MFGVLGKSFMTAARTDQRIHWNGAQNWPSQTHPDDRFATRRGAEAEAHTTGRRRD